MLAGEKLGVRVDSSWSRLRPWWPFAIVQTVLSAASNGIIPTGPRVRVIVFDLRTGERLLERDWARDASAAVRDERAISETLETMSYDDFCNHYFIRRPGDGGGGGIRVVGR